MLVTVPEIKVYSVRLDEEIKNLIEPPDEKSQARRTGGKAGGFSLFVRQMCYLFLGRQTPADQMHLKLDDSAPLRRMEADVYRLEAAVYKERRDLTADERAELETLERKLLDLALEHAAGRKPSFEQMLSLVLLGRYYALTEHLQEGRRGE